jgi:hypothetical protein
VQPSRSVLAFFRRAAVPSALLLAIGLAACGDDGGTEPPVTVQPTLASIQQEIFTPTCARSGCHTTAQKEGGLDLSTGNALENLVNVTPSTRDAELEGWMRVVAGDPEKSFLLHKLRAGLPANMGRRMPYDGPYLRDAEIDVIEQWIADGANP